MLGRLLRSLFVAGLAPALWATAARAQDRVSGAVPGASATGTIGGRVTEAFKEAPITGATVRVLGQEAVTPSDSSGRFTLRGVRLGIVTIEVRRLGFAPVTKGNIVVSPATPAEVAVMLRAIDVTLDAVTVRPEAFPSQMAVSTPMSTQAYDAEEVRRQPGAQEDVLRAVSIAPGVGVTSAGRNGVAVGRWIRRAIGRPHVVRHDAHGARR